VQQSSQTSEKREKHSEGILALKRVIKTAGQILAATAITGAFYAAIVYHAVDDIVALKKGRPPQS